MWPVSAREVVGVHGRGDVLDEPARLGEDVAVEHAWLVGPDPAGEAVRVGVHGEEVPGVPDRVADQPDRLGEPLLLDDDVVAAQHRRAEQVPPHGVGPVGGEHLLGVGEVAQTLG